MNAAKEWTLGQLGEAIERGFKAVAEDVAQLDGRIDHLAAAMATKEAFDSA